MKEKKIEQKKNNTLPETAKNEDEKIVIPLSKKLLKSVLLIITFTVVLCWVFTHFETVKSTFYYFFINTRLNSTTPPTFSMINVTCFNSICIFKQMTYMLRL